MEKEGINPPEECGFDQFICPLCTTLNGIKYPKHSLTHDIYSPSKRCPYIEWKDADGIFYAFDIFESKKVGFRWRVNFWFIDDDVGCKSILNKNVKDVADIKTLYKKYA